MENFYSIGFDAKRAFFNYSGLGNYSRNLLRALIKCYPANNYILFTPGIHDPAIFPESGQFTVVEPESAILKHFSTIWRRRFLTRAVANSQVDIYHGLSQELPAGLNKIPVKKVVTVHDLIFVRYPELYSRIDASLYLRKLQHACRIADRIVAISEQTKSDLVEYLGVDAGRITVIYQGCNPAFRESLAQERQIEVRLKYNLPERYLLYVGTIERRKNLLGILKGMNYAGIEMPLVAIGRKVSSYYREVMEFIDRAGMKNILFPGQVQNHELPLIYKGAECFIYPSFFEGFGIPVLEALVSGTPVITSAGSCLAEAGGPASIYVDPADPEQIGNAISEVTGSREKREKMTEAGKKYALNFTDEKIASDYMQLYISLFR